MEFETPTVAIGRGRSHGYVSGRDQLTKAVRAAGIHAMVGVVAFRPARNHFERSAADEPVDAPCDGFGRAADK